MPGDRDRLAKSMNTSRAEQRVTWEVVADRGQVSVATLRRVRNQVDSELTEDTKLAIEDGLDWHRGDVDRVLDGGTYTYRTPLKRARRPLDPRASSVEDILDFLAELRVSRGSVYEELRLAILDVNWLPKHPAQPPVE